MSVKIIRSTYPLFFDDQDSNMDYPKFIGCTITKKDLNLMKEMIQKTTIEHIEKDLKEVISNPSLFFPYTKKNNQYKTIERYNKVTISNTDFYFSFIIKGTKLELLSYPIKYSIAEKYLFLGVLPIEHMPLYINDEDEDIRNIARERLEKKE